MVYRYLLVLFFFINLSYIYASPCLKDFSDKNLVISSKIKLNTGDAIACIIEDLEGNRIFNLSLNDVSILSIRYLIPCSSCMGRDDFLDIYDDDDGVFSVVMGSSSIVVEKKPTCYPIKEISVIRKYTDEEGLYINPTREIKATTDSFGTICLADYDKKKGIIDKLMSMTNKEIDHLFKDLYKKIIQNEKTVDGNILRKYASISHGAGLTKNSYVELMHVYGVMQKRRFNDLSIEILDLVNEYFLLGKITSKAYLYKSPNKPTKMYLIKGDIVTILDEKTDDTNQKWYFINYKGKKDLTMWIKAEAVDIEPIKETTEKTEQEIKTLTPKEPAETTKQAPVTTPPKNAEIIKAKKAEPIEKSASGSTSLTLLASLLGLLAWRAG